MTAQASSDPNRLVNLVSEIESRLGGTALAPGFSGGLTGAIPDAPTIVLVLFDGLGMAQLGHSAASRFSDSLAGTLEAGFPTTTSTSLATIASGLPPGQHGVVAHLTWMPEHNRVVNTLKWVDLAGDSVHHEYATLLPRPNLWERLRIAGIEPITVQPGDFAPTPLTRTLYRGARFEGIWGVEDLVDATIHLAAEPSRFIFTYVPHVDVAGHVFGQESDEFTEAIRIATRVWDELSRRLPPGAVLVGTADHGLVDYGENQKLLIREPRFDQLRFAGDPRGVHLWCGDDDANALADLTGGKLVVPAALFGPDPAAVSMQRSGKVVLLAPKGVALLPRGFDKRLRAYHGGLDPREVEIPLLVG
jgi:predicted AlkP superfamily pyrophosphatase or phosphodiesterase